jgi:hypothetical protein
MSSNQMMPDIFNYRLLPRRVRRSVYHGFTPISNGTSHFPSPGANEYAILCREIKTLASSDRNHGQINLCTGPTEDLFLARRFPLCLTGRSRFWQTDD